MSYRITPDGMIMCDTIDEALQAVRHIVGQSKEPTRKLRVVKPQKAPGIAKVRRPKAPAADPTALYSSLKPEQQKLLDYLKANGETSLEGLRNGLKLKGKYQLSGLLSGLQRAITRAGMDPAKVLVREKTGSGAAAVVTYKAGPALAA